MEGTANHSRLTQAALLLAAVAAGGVLLFTAAVAQSGQTDLSPGHRCARCHLNDMLEWGTSGHADAGTVCTDCHGPSEDHVIDERNNVKPDQVPRGAAIAGLCLGCHGGGCPSSKRKDGCARCHHVHALVDVTKQPDPDTEMERFEQESRRYRDAMRRGDDLVAKSEWNGALREYEAALEIRPGDERATNRVAFARRRLNPQLAGFRIQDDEFDADSGLPLHIEIPEQHIEMVLVPGGSADIGDPSLPDSRLVHTVTVEPFYLARHEVTQEQWTAVMGSNPSAYQEGFAEHARMPVESVSWEDCQRFIARLNAQVAGQGFRLPTEAEWEYALRRGGDAIAGLDAVAWYRDNSQIKKRGRRDEPSAFSAPRPVGTKGANLLGLYDMQGNVWEWCSSLFLPYPYDGTDGREDPTAKGLRVLRGGGFTDRSNLLTPAFRHADRPNRRLPWNGLRLAR